MRQQPQQLLLLLVQRHRDKTVYIIDFKGYF